MGSSMKTVCPHCQHEFELAKGMAGKPVSCSLCKQSFIAALPRFCIHCGQLNSCHDEFCRKCGKSLCPKRPPVKRTVQVKTKISMRIILPRLLFLGGLCGSALLFTTLANYAGDNNSFLKILAVIGAFASISMLAYSSMVFCNAVGDSKNLPRMIRNTFIFFIGFYLVTGVVFLGVKVKNWWETPSRRQAIATSSPISNGDIFFPIDFESDSQEINELLNDTVYTVERLSRLLPRLQERRISQQVLIDRKQTAENTAKAFESISRDYPMPELDKNLDKELELVLREIAIFNMKRENDISKYEELTRRLREIGKQVKQQNQKVHQLHQKMLRELQ